MPDKEKKSEFTVTDRRLFSAEGELRPDVVEAEERREEREQEKREAQQRANEERARRTPPPSPGPRRTHHLSRSPADYPVSPSAADQQASAEAYKQSTREIDKEIRKELDKHGQAHRAKDFEMNFEKFIASLYMSALMQLGMAAPEGGAAAGGSDGRAPDHRHHRPAAGEDQGQPDTERRNHAAERALRAAHGLSGSDQPHRARLRRRAREAMARQR